jgi:ABC-type lipoprotein export system ATPase subunit
MALLRLEDVRKDYTTPSGERTRVLDVPRLELEAGQQVALHGPSGTGKTTLLNAIAGILRPDSGHIWLSGTDLCGLSEARRDRLRAEQVGYVFQTFNLLQGYTALENVALGMAFGPGVDRPFALQLLERLDLGDRVDYRPAELSVGQQQRVALARALANRPALVLADEPTGALDPVRADEAVGLLRELCAEQGAALLIVSHDDSVLERFETRLDLREINRAFDAGAA